MTDSERTNAFIGCSDCIVGWIRWFERATGLSRTLVAGAARTASG